jgi:tripartite motif-containing protein 9/67
MPKYADQGIIIVYFICIIGKDDKGWGMYVDHQRSWFMNCGMHSCRTEGGIGAGSTIGILLDLERRQLTFYVNEEQQVSFVMLNFI